ncbi:MAG: tRNA (guanosine(37)-N1)-methyltransferase TrmD [Candidatus Magasanikbacteria bacterium RIFCSPHIGHO2_02_FULL_50_9b]|uniref:tRNA (guanine-N(1)-)-methyltransferase n=1 Tax=Candidatus Magasanikbacteria bacterium RIFCSPHIGHO2_02_FULL_50_9b TaxID=1798682 RepID=A0A1F6M929_9BACT|nr:MAG: tRNA (guanosine(37)-N1)-methyltransferase TrmD [Candidatus Magasanikbacteria bacterium RIFCSPHIGHO2_02_FULL_50_9b]
MKFTVITLFPELIAAYTNAAMLGRAQKKHLISVATINPRDFTQDAHQTVDDKPFGGGAGMVMKIEPLYRAIKKAAPRKNKKCRVILLSASGRPFTQAVAQEFAARYTELVFVCGRYEGVDARVAEHLVDEELSVGSYVLTGGELPALTVIDAVARLIQGVLGNAESLAEESHNTDNTGEYPQYTRPEKFKTWRVPPELLSGNHAAIAAWRRKNLKKIR